MSLYMYIVWKYVLSFVMDAFNGEMMTPQFPNCQNILELYCKVSACFTVHNCIMNKVKSEMPAAGHVVMQSVRTLVWVASFVDMSQLGLRPWTTEN